MNCYFCQQKCRRDNDLNRKWFCDHHIVPVHYLRYNHNEGDGPPDFLHFNHQYKDKEYTVWLTLIPYSDGRQYVPCDIQYHTYGHSTKQLIQFSFIPNFTPENFLQKLPTILTFS